MIRLVYFNWMDPSSRKRLLEGREKVIRDFQRSLDRMEPQKHVHPLILEYGNKSRQEELDLIARFKQLVQSPCLMHEDGNIHE